MSVEVRKPLNEHVPHQEKLDLNSITVFITGLPTSGKTTIAEGAAKKLGIRVIDTDQEIRRVKEIEIGIPVTVEDIINEDGMKEGDKPEKKPFRTREAEVISALSTQRGLMISTGGGAVETLENRETFKRPDVLVIYVSARPETCASRAVEQKNEDRPLYEIQTSARSAEQEDVELTDEERRKKKEEMYQKTLATFLGRHNTRKGWFLETLDIVLDNDCDDPTGEVSINALVEAFEDGTLLEIFKAKQPKAA